MPLHAFDNSRPPAHGARALMTLFLALTCVACATTTEQQTAKRGSCRVGERSVIDRMWDEKQDEMDVFMVSTRCKKTALGWLLYGHDKPR